MSIDSKLESFGFHFGRTGGDCTAYIKTLPDGSEVYITLVEGEDTPDLEAPDSIDDRVMIGAQPMRSDGNIHEEYVWWWVGRLGDFLDMLREHRGSKRYLVLIREVVISHREVFADSKEQAIERAPDADEEYSEYSHTLDQDTWTVEELPS